MENLKSVRSNSPKRNAVIPLEKGKLPPQAVELEETVLGAMMIDKKGVVQKLYAKVKVTGHTEAVLSDLKAL